MDEAMLLLRRLLVLGINTPHIRVLRDNHTSQEYDVGRVRAQLKPAWNAPNL